MHGMRAVRVSIKPLLYHADMVHISARLFKFSPAYAVKPVRKVVRNYCRTFKACPFRQHYAVPFLHSAGGKYAAFTGLGYNGGAGYHARYRVRNFGMSAYYFNVCRLCRRAQFVRYARNIVLRCAWRDEQRCEQTYRLRPRCRGIVAAYVHRKCAKVLIGRCYGIGRQHSYAPAHVHRRAVHANLRGTQHLAARMCKFR